MSKEKEKATRRSNRVELTQQEAAFTIRALEQQIETLNAQADWPSVIPFSKESVIEAHEAVISKIKSTAHFTAPEAMTAKRTGRQARTNGATAEASV